MCDKSRSLRQEELDAYWRYAFVKDIIKQFDNGLHARFVVFGSVSKKYRLVDLRKAREGEWEMSISGLITAYTYSYSAVIDFIEQIWNKSMTALHLDGEVEFEFKKPTANEDAEKSEKGESNGAEDCTKSL